MKLYIAHPPICEYGRVYHLEAAMTLRDMQRLLASFGISASYLDQVTRRLREVGRIPNAGRGGTAPDLQPHEAAIVLLAFAGSDTATRPLIALARLALLEIDGDVSARHARRFIPAVEAILTDGLAASSVAEIRVAQGNGPSSIIYDDGHVETFIPSDRPALPAFRAEGIIWGGLIGELQLEMSGKRNLPSESATKTEEIQRA